MPLATICDKNQALKTIICFFLKLKTAAGRSFLRHSGSDVKTLPLYGDACSAKSFEVLPLIFITDCSPIGWLQSVLKIRSFENFFLSFLNFFQATRLRGGVNPLFHPSPPHVLYSGTNMILRPILSASEPEGNTCTLIFTHVRNAFSLNSILYPWKTFRYLF